VADRKFGVQFGWLSHRIHVGRLNKAQDAFLDGKEDCTNEAVWAAAEYVAKAYDGEMELTNPAGTTMRIRAEVVSNPQRPNETPQMSEGAEMIGGRPQ
jgi:hypothetical protein